jgi:hypothetical protein
MVLFRFRTQLAIQCCGRKMKGMLTVSNKADLDCSSLNKNVSPGLVRIESKHFAGLYFEFKTRERPPRLLLKYYISAISSTLLKKDDRRQTY